MRYFLIFISLFVLRFLFLPMDITNNIGFRSLAYHILVGIAIGMTAVIIDLQITKFKNRKKQ